jgi:ankyrin repeat protein
VTDAIIAHKDLYDCTALHYAARHGYLYCLKVLLSVGNKMLDFDPHSVLFEALYRGHSLCVKYLLENVPLYIDYVNAVGDGFLKIAVIHFHHKSLKLLLNYPGIHVNKLDHNNRSVLMYAAEYGNKKAMVLLIKQGAFIKILDKKGCSALHYAAGSGNVDCIRILVENGMHCVDVPNVNETTALHIAARNGDYSMTKELLSLAQTSVWMVNEKGYTPFEYVFQFHRTKLIMDLFKNIALWRAIQTNDGNLLQKVLELSIDINQQNAEGWTPLECAINDRHFNLVHTLLKQGGCEIRKPFKRRTKWIRQMMRGYEDALERESKEDSEPSEMTGLSKTTPYLQSKKSDSSEEKKRSSTDTLRRSPTFWRPPSIKTPDYLDIGSVEPIEDPFSPVYSFSGVLQLKR